MAHRYVHIGIMFGTGVSRITDLEPVMNIVGDDWVRYAGNSWITWTARSNAEIAAMMRRVLTLDDQFVLFEIDPLNRDGMHEQWIWNWLDEYRYEGYKAPPPTRQPPLLPPQWTPPKR